MVVTISRDGSDLRLLRRHPMRSSGDPALVVRRRVAGVSRPWIDGVGRACVLAPAHGGPSRVIARAAYMRGVAWMPDGGLVYSSSAGSTCPYPPAFNLRRVDGDGSNDVQITFGDLSFVEPDIHAAGRLVACRIRSESDI